MTEEFMAYGAVFRLTINARKGIEGFGRSALQWKNTGRFQIGQIDNKSMVLSILLIFITMDVMGNDYRPR
jgi:hypothetical protein